jgi:hypothetical protein
MTKVFLECDIRTAIPSSDDAMSTSMTTSGRARFHRVNMYMVIFFVLYCSMFEDVKAMMKYVMEAAGRC